MHNVSGRGAVGAFMIFSTVLTAGGENLISLCHSLYFLWAADRTRVRSGLSAAAERLFPNSFGRRLSSLGVMGRLPFAITNFAFISAL